MPRQKGFLSVNELPLMIKQETVMRKLLLISAILIVACISVYAYAVGSTPATSVMPETTSMLLLGSALMGAGALIRRRFRARS
jgi:hypothetical protein